MNNTNGFDKETLPEMFKHLRFIHFTLIVVCISIFYVSTIDRKSQGRLASGELDVLIASLPEISKRIQKLKIAALAEANSSTPLIYGDEYIFLNSKAAMNVKFNPTNSQEFELSFGLDTLIPNMDFERFDSIIDSCINEYCNLEELNKLWDSVMARESFLMVFPNFENYYEIAYGEFEARDRTYDSYIVYDAYHDAESPKRNPKEKGEFYKYTLEMSSYGFNKDPDLYLGSFDVSFGLDGLEGGDDDCNQFIKEYGAEVFEGEVGFYCFEIEYEAMFRYKYVLKGSSSVGRNVSIKNSVIYKNFDIEFRNLIEITESFREIPLSSIKRIIRTIDEHSRAEVKLLGVDVSISDIREYGIYIIVLLQIYFFLHFAQLVKMDVSLLRFPWIGLYRQKMSKIVYVLSAHMLPMILVSYSLYTISMTKEHYTSVFLISFTSILVSILHLVHWHKLVNGVFHANKTHQI